VARLVAVYLLIMAVNRPISFALLVDSSEGWLRRLRRRTLNSVTINQPSSAGLHHGDLAETLLAFYRSRAEMKSEDRDQYISYLKMSGQ